MTARFHAGTPFQPERPIDGNSWLCAVWHLKEIVAYAAGTSKEEALDRARMLIDRLFE